MTQSPDTGEDGFRRDRRQHAGAPDHLDDDRLAHLAEEERVAAGLDDFDPDDVPPATDAPVPTDITESEQYQDERGEIKREEARGELPEGGLRDAFPPTRYDET
ncbi:MAG: hypothetical protein QOJ73_6591 [Streptosporangiaceae bacterium]|jgi:hypothetical protein|nr:hypothetical protein [Streptosporangiaceae bacterium]